MSPVEQSRRALGRARSLLAGRSRWIAAGIAAGVTAAGVTVARRRSAEVVTLPDPSPLALETAVSVHNAAKGSVIAATREAEVPDQTVMTDAVRAALTEATESGVDLTVVALGAVEGAADVAHLLGVSPREAAVSAALVAAEAAASQGATAGSRVHDLLAAHLPLA